MNRRIVAATVLIAWFVMVGVVFAAQTAPAAPAANGVPQLPFKLGGGILNGIVAGVIGGMATVVTGVAKSKDPVTGAQEQLDFSKAWETLMIGGVLGGFAGYFKIAPADAATFLTTSPLGAGIVCYAEMAWNAVFRQSVGLIRKTLGLFKTPPADSTPGKTS